MTNRKSDRRLYFFICIWMVVGVIIIIHLFRLQVLNYEIYRNKAASQHDLYKILKPKRGEIFFQNPKEIVTTDLKLSIFRYGKNLYPTAINRDYGLVWANPQVIKNPISAAKTLNQVLDLKTEEVLANLQSKDKEYIVIKNKLSLEETQKISKLNLQGIYLSSEVWRYYPLHNKAGQVLGFVGDSENGKVGRYGIEYYFEDTLKGKDGFSRAEKDPSGTWIAFENKEIMPPVDGDDLILTIDYNLQVKVCQDLELWVKKHEARSGTVLVGDPQTGAILAMCSVPNYDPNEYRYVKNLNLFNNPAIFDQYEPGSIFKPITLAAGLDVSKITANTTYEDRGKLKISGHVVQNSDKKAHGVQTMTQVLEKSLNTGVIFIMRLVGVDILKKYTQDFGFGAVTDISLYGETKGNIKALDETPEIYHATASFGQGVTVTPLQMLMAYGAIANDGQLMKPYLVKEIRKSNGSIIRNNPLKVRTPISKSTANILSAMMVSVVDNGHGKAAGVPGYYIAGKTGTAQVPKKNAAGYDEDNVIGSFVGFGPLSNPKIVMLVKIDNPQKVKFAESSAAPLFGQLMKFMLEYYEIPPDRK